MASPQTRLRLAILAFAMLIGVQAAWVLVAELAAFAAGGARGAAELARWRGDLWAACAQDGRNEAAAERAVRLAPHEAGAWLVLVRSPPPDANAAECLKMSYYIGPNAARADAAAAVGVGAAGDARRRRCPPADAARHPHRRGPAGTAQAGHRDGLPPGVSRGPARHRGRCVRRRRRARRDAAGRRDMTQEMV